MKRSFKVCAFIYLLGSTLSTHAIIDSTDGKDISRRVQGAVSVAISCAVTETGTPCDKIGLQSYGTCGEKSLTLKYEYCNNLATGQGDIIPLRTDPNGEIRTSAMYRQEWGKPSLVLSPMAPQVCRTAIVTELVDTCIRKFVAAIKFEVW